MRPLLALIFGISLVAPKPLVAQNVVTTETKFQDAMVRTYRDPITDDQITTVTLEGKNLILGWGCKEEKWVMMLGGTRTLAVGGTSEVTLRFDEQPADAPVRWPVSGGRKFANSPDTITRPLTVRAMKARQLVVRARDPITDRSVTEVFGLMGLTRALGMLPCDKP